MKVILHFSATILMILSLNLACSDDLQQNEVHTTQSKTTGDDQSQDGKKSSSSTNTGTNPSSVTNPTQGTGTGGSGTPPPSTGTPDPDTGKTPTEDMNTPPPDDNTGGDNAAEKKQQAFFYFNQSVAPLLESGCIGCHVGPRLPAEIRADEEIYVDEIMYARMTDGTSSVDNAFINRVRNAIGNHPGGDRCAGDITNSPCKEIVEFGKIHYGDAGELPPEFGFLDIGLTNSVTDSPDNWSGTIIGWAFNTNAPADTVTVEIYSGDADAGGTLLGSATANQSGSTFEKQVPSGNHKFIFTIPEASVTSGVPMNIFVYSMINGAREEIGKFTETFYAPQNLDFFNNNIAGLVGPTDCGGCHSAGRTALGVFSGMAKVKPSKGGTATGNSFYQRISGVNHSGGNVCGAQLCNLIQQWWNLEFGN